MENKIFDDRRNMDANIGEPLEKAKKPRTAAQLESFKKAQEIRKENIKLLKEIKETKKAESKIKQLETKKELLKDAIRSVTTPKSESESESASEEEEPAQASVVVRRTKPKKPKRIIVVESDSDDDAPIEKQRSAGIPPQVIQSATKIMFY